MTAITDSFSPKETLHGVLVSVDSIGVLIAGDAGTGKSECALALIARGHKLVADDVVEIELANGRLLGKAPEQLSGRMNLRGLGIVAIDRLFGAAAVERAAYIDLYIRLEVGKGLNSDRIGEEMSEVELLGLKIPALHFSYSCRRNLPLLVETAVKLVKMTMIRADF